MGQKEERKRRILSRGNEKYAKVSHKAKILLLKMVVCDRLEIKESAQSLKINYSTAKTLMRKFKTQGEDMDAEVLKGISNWFEVYAFERQRCGYRTIDRSIPGKYKTKGIKKLNNEDTVDVDFRIPQISLSSAHQEQATKIRILQQVLFKN